MRNELVHGYFRVDREIVWDAIQTDLPPLALAMQHVLDSEKA